MSDPSPPPLIRFSFNRGVVEGDADQALVDAFAADFQGLRHYGAKIGETLDLGEPWTGTLQERDLTVGYAYAGAGVAPHDPGAGALAARALPLYEMLLEITGAEG